MSAENDLVSYNADLPEGWREAPLGTVADVRFSSVDKLAYRSQAPVFKYWLDTGAFTRVAKQTTSVAHLGADRFAKMPFPRPTLFEQRLIADRLAEIAAMQETEASELRKLCNIKAGLMSDLLTGRVRVPADLMEARP